MKFVYSFGIKSQVRSPQQLLIEERVTQKLKENLTPSALELTYDTTHVTFKKSCV